MDLLQNIEQAYRGFVPHHEYLGKLGEVSVYVMNNIGGTCMYLARDELQCNNYKLLRSTIDDYARFFVSAYHNTPATMTRPDRKELLDTYMTQLRKLREGLPERFHSTLDKILPQVPDLFAEDWPLVPNHTDLLENNIHVDKATGRITGICDWREAQVSPFGLSLGGLETLLGLPITSGDFWRYHPNHQELRNLFRERFYHYLGEASYEKRQRFEVARLVGLFLANAFDHEKPATEESEDLQFLGDVMLK